MIVMACHWLQYSVVTRSFLKNMIERLSKMDGIQSLVQKCPEWKFHIAWMVCKLTAAFPRESLEFAVQPRCSWEVSMLSTATLLPSSHFPWMPRNGPIQEKISSMPSSWKKHSLLIIHVCRFGLARLNLWAWPSASSLTYSNGKSFKRCDKLSRVGTGAVILLENPARLWPFYYISEHLSLGTLTQADELYLTYPRCLGGCKHSRQFLPIARSNSFGGHHRFTTSTPSSVATVPDAGPTSGEASLLLAFVEASPARPPKESRLRRIGAAISQDFKDMMSQQSLHFTAFRCICFPFHPHNISLPLLAPFWPSSHCPWSPNPAMGPWIRGPVADHQSPCEFVLDEDTNGTRWDEGVIKLRYLWNYRTRIQVSLKVKKHEKYLVRHFNSTFNKSIDVTKTCNLIIMPYVPRFSNPTPPP